jgi:hypothetical protein
MSTHPTLRTLVKKAPNYEVRHLLIYSWTAHAPIHLRLAAPVVRAKIVKLSPDSPCSQRVQVQQQEFRPLWR